MNASSNWVDLFKVSLGRVLRTSLYTQARIPTKWRSHRGHRLGDVTSPRACPERFVRGLFGASLCACTLLSIAQARRCIIVRQQCTASHIVVREKKTRSVDRPTSACCCSRPILCPKTSSIVAALSDARCGAVRG